MLPIIFLPGMMCDARLFFPQIAALSCKHTVLIAPMGEARTMAKLAELVLEKAPPRFALAGLSMGGILAMEILKQASERVDRVALLDTNPLAERPEIKARRVPQIEAVQSGELARVMREQMIPNYFANDVSTRNLQHLCVEMALQLGPEVFINQSIALRDRPDQTETLRGFTGKSLVVCGREDVLCPVDRHELMRDLLPDSRLEIIEDAGHLITLEKPEQTTAALTRWMEEE